MPPSEQNPIGDPPPRRPTGLWQQMLVRAHESVGEKEYREFLDRLKKQTSQRLKGQPHEHRSHHYSDSRDTLPRTYPPSGAYTHTGRSPNPLPPGYIPGRQPIHPGSPSRVARSRPGLDPAQVQHTTVALVGWKGAGVTINDGIIVSSHGATEWPAYERLTAKCHRAEYLPPGFECSVPALDCNCGIHAGIKARTAHPYAANGCGTARRSGDGYLHDSVSCLIETNLWGTIMVNETGYRAQFAYPKRVFLIFDYAGSRTIPLVVERVRNRYGVPVENMNWEKASKLMDAHS